MKTILVDQDPQFLSDLESVLHMHWPCADIVAKCTKNQHALEEMVKSKCDLLFLNVSQFVGRQPGIEKISTWVPKTIFMANTYEHAADAIKYSASGYLLKPLHGITFIDTLRGCVERLSPPQNSIAKSPVEESAQEQIICIPTIEGAEFLRPVEIIRCEGLQKCTRVVARQRSDIVSSYHIGVFRDLLQGGRFVQSHKSHIVNLNYIKTYHRDGTIYMSDGSTVPLSRRRKEEFFRHVRTLNRLP